MTRILTFVTFVVVIGLCALGAQSPAVSSVVRLDPALDEIIAVETKAELLKGNYFGFLEGPAWVRDGGRGYLLFSDVPANNIYKWVLADRYEGRRLNSPNDLVMKSNGSVYFTDPPGGLRGGARSPAKELIDMTADPAPGGTDGMKVDQNGNVYCTAPGGVWIISPAGKHLGTIRPPEQPANLAFGDADAKSLYLTARQSLYRIRTKIPGILP